MPKLGFRRRTLSLDNGGRVYFCAHPEDALQRKVLMDDVLDLSDCIAYFDGDPRGEENAEWAPMLSDMQLFVVAVSRRFLSEPSRARDVELALALKLHISILPILVEAVDLPAYNLVFPDIQYLDPKDNSDAALPYRQKLERALGEVLQDATTRSAIRDSFDLSFFLSYRKKDRRHAQKLLEKIHSREKYQSIAIWYDEFLLPGEDFNHSIEQAMDKSSLFLMSVTPHMLEPTNYVMDVEFPAATEKGMRILAVETQSTDRDEFSDKFQNAPPLISIEDEEVLFAALSRITSETDAKEHTVLRTYYLGVAYLNGISVEVNRPLGVRLIHEAADAGCMPAIQKLINMYHCGDGVERSYAEALRLREKQIDCLYAAFEDKRTGKNFEEYLSALLDLARDYVNLGDYVRARETLEKTKTKADHLRNTRKLSIVGQRYMRIATHRLASVERMAGNLDEAIMILKSNLPYFRFELEESGSDDDRQALAVLLQELAALYDEKGNMAKSEKFANEALALSEMLASRESSTALSRYNLATNLFNKAITLSKQANYQEAVEVCFRGMEILSSAKEHHESSALYIRFHLLLGEQYMALRNLGAASEAFEKAVEICESPSTVQDIVTLKLKAEAKTSLGEVSISMNDLMEARRNLRGADKIYEEVISQFGEKAVYRRRAKIAFLDAQICCATGLIRGAVYNYEECIEYMEMYTEEAPKAQDLHILALANYLLGAMNRQSPDMPRLQQAFTIWSDLAQTDGNPMYAKHRDEVAAMLVRFMF